MLASDYDLEDKAIVIPSKAVATEMFQENLKESLSKLDLGGDLSARGLHNPELMNLIIFGATTAFDKTFTVMYKQKTKQPLDNRPSAIAGPAREAQDDGEWHQPLVTDLTEISSQDGEITALALGEVPNPTFQHVSEVDLLTEIGGLENDFPIELLSWDQPQHQRQSQFFPQPDHGELLVENHDCNLCGASFKTRVHLLAHVCAPASAEEGSSTEPISASLQENVHIGFDITKMSGVENRGNALDGNLVADSNGNTSVEMGGPPDATAQNTSTALEDGNSEQPQSLRMLVDDFADWWSQSDPDFGDSNWVLQ
ncbi:hypothetical protein NW768_006750 [Fusarium equiseti]|uniref:C2H2-type domain-containing protein n=1 Tax=Fusarium equiseti TaxID=61235 RepID=A0ABQ8R9E3_FUSEQ|nr:hypothetical protein NW768_006750 [Fusarium equiseti]